MGDNRTYCVDQLSRLKWELAALVRQYGRGADAGDTFAQEVEAEAICNGVRWLV